MILRRLQLVNFRNFAEQIFDLNSHLTVIVGDNAKGKTNLLEAIYFLINGVGFRESREEELITLVKEHGSVAGIISDNQEKSTFRIALKKQDNGTVKQYLINNAKKRHQPYIREQTKAILFTPEQIEIVTGAPERRRDYFNKTIGYYDLSYKRCINNYDHALHKRNRILESHHDDKKLQGELAFWDEYLVKQAQYITSKRQEYCGYLNINGKLDYKEFAVYYHKNEMTKMKLAEVYHLEKRYRRTLIGPQKDDFYFMMKNHPEKNVSHFGSRSEQRLTIFWLKLNEIKYCEDRLKRTPILLLDDIFSELDRKNIMMILSLIKQYQTVITATDDAPFSQIDIPKTTIRL